MLVPGFYRYEYQLLTFYIICYKTNTIDKNLSFYNQTQHATGTGLFTVWNVG